MTRGTVTSWVVVVVAGLCLAPQASGKVIPVSNWPVPDDAGLVLSALDLSNPVPFIPVTPCRVADTRGNGFTGEWGPPNLAANESRDFTIAGQCGIPAAGVKAVSFNFTVVSTGTGAGFLRVYPAGGTVPVVSTLNWLQWATAANAAVVPLSAGGAITVNTSAGGAAVIIDVNGYYGDTPAVGYYFELTTDSEEMGLKVSNLSATCQGTCGIGSYVYSTSVPGATSVLGVAYGTGGPMTGVKGYVTTTTPGSSGVKGEAIGDSGVVYGVIGTTASSSTGASGVLGVDGVGISGTGQGYWSSGVRGEGQNGVTGFSRTSGGFGVFGFFFDPTTGGGVAGGYLGSSAYGVYAQGNLGASGAKTFVEPHPTEAGKVIRYVSLEGPEAGTYFRGKGQFVGRSAVIEVPESFRMVSDAEELSIQVTPIGDLATVAVISIDLDRVVLRSSRDVSFFFTVNGVRRAFKDWQAVEDGNEYTPRSAVDTMPAYLSEEAKRRLIANGTYHEDGTVNLETAQRLGWAAVWREQEAASQAASEATAARLRAQEEDTPKP